MLFESINKRTIAQHHCPVYTHIHETDMNCGNIFSSSTIRTNLFERLTDKRDGEEHFVLYPDSGNEKNRPPRHIYKNTGGKKREGSTITIRSSQPLTPRINSAFIDQTSERSDYQKAKKGSVIYNKLKVRVTER